MRHISTLLIAFRWRAILALLAAVTALDPGHGILAAPSLLGAAPTPDAFFPGGGLPAAGFFSFAFAAAGVLFLRTPAAALFSEGAACGALLGHVAGRSRPFAPGAAR